jgi:PadR family transcriptional regulator, regulatory protein PadR
MIDDTRTLMIRGHLKIIILAIMSKRDVTGYDIAKSIKETTGEMPSFGSIYPLLKLMVAEKLAKTRTIKRKKYYTITSQGQATLKKVAEHKHKIIQQIKEGMMMFQTISKEDCEFFGQVLDSMQGEHMPLQSLGDERLKIAKRLLEMETNGIINKHNTEIKKIFKDTLKRLNSLK